jgi:hypothetical protein
MVHTVEYSYIAEAKKKEKRKAEDEGEKSRVISVDGTGKLRRVKCRRKEPGMPTLAKCRAPGPDNNIGLQTVGTGRNPCSVLKKKRAQ